MPEALETTVIAAVFEAAVTSPDWTEDRRGKRVEVQHAGYNYTVEIDSSGHFLAEIIDRSSWGNIDYVVPAPAAPEMHSRLVDAADAAIAARKARQGL